MMFLVATNQLQRPLSPPGAVPLPPWLCFVLHPQPPQFPRPLDLYHRCRRHHIVIDIMVIVGVPFPGTSS